MKRSTASKVVTANHLLEGEVVWLTAEGHWTTRLSKAEAFADPARAEERLRHAIAQSNRVVGAYLADVRLGPQGPEPVHFREEFRTRGPSNYPHGKQAGE